MSDPVPGRENVRQLSDEEIIKTFDRLVEAWDSLVEAREKREMFNLDYRPPEDPAVTIESTEAMIEYNRQKWRYEQKREEIENRHAQHEEHYRTTSEIVRSLLPVGHTLVHTYRGDHPERQGDEYTIEHGVAETTPGVQGQPPSARVIVRSRRSRPSSKTSRLAPVHYRRGRRGERLPTSIVGRCFYVCPHRENGGGVRQCGPGPLGPGLSAKAGRASWGKGNGPL
jgi:hypothetical protein